MGALFSKLMSLFSGKELDILMVGLANSGKTTLLNVISDNEPGETLPTVGVNFRKVKKGNITMKVADLGGQERFRNLWVEHTKTCDVVIFVVDGADVDKVPESKKELHKLLENKTLDGKPVLIILNKIDLERRFTKDEIVKHMNLDYIDQKRNPWCVLPISALHKTNITDVIDWLLKQSEK
ncbi:hypothetical protein ABK040_006419 [Willaertia magna]